MDKKEMQEHEKLYRELETRVKERVKRVAKDLDDFDAANRVGLYSAIHLLAFVLGGIISSVAKKGSTVQDQASLVDRDLHQLVDKLLKDAGIDWDDGAPWCPHRN